MHGGITFSAGRADRPTLTAGSEKLFVPNQASFTLTSSRTAATARCSTRHTRSRIWHLHRPLGGQQSSSAQLPTLARRSRSRRQAAQGRNGEAQRHRFARRALSPDLQRVWLLGTTRPVELFRLVARHCRTSTRPSPCWPDRQFDAPDLAEAWDQINPEPSIETSVALCASASTCSTNPSSIPKEPPVCTSAGAPARTTRHRRSIRRHPRRNLAPEVGATPSRQPPTPRTRVEDPKHVELQINVLLYPGVGRHHQRG